MRPDPQPTAHRGACSVRLRVATAHALAARSERTTNYFLKEEELAPTTDKNSEG